MEDSKIFDFIADHKKAHGESCPLNLFVHYTHAERFETLREALRERNVELIIVDENCLHKFSTLIGERDQHKIFPPDNIYLAKRQ